ncbi:MAG: class 1 fructose-bisphosphatase [Candidatus Dadabacteria bacterium]|nr:MAG: class 1 fructose-bisphosphatase [Candidatus Dadabacteria bacterium]
MYDLNVKERLTAYQYLLKDKLAGDKNRELIALLKDLKLAARQVSKELNSGALNGTLGELTGSKNTHGEKVKKLDLIANNLFIKSLENGGNCCGLVSEENDKVIIFNNETSKKSKYLVLIDPLDGSSNIDVNVPVGTIFSVLKKPANQRQTLTKDFLQEGTKQVAAGYIIYGSSTIYVLTVGKGVDAFTLDPVVQEFYLSYKNIKMPKKARMYSVNQGNFFQFSNGVQEYITWCEQKDSKTGRPYSLRYVGSMVADLHRSLLKGGLFIYSQAKGAPQGKLRLMYECNPMAFIIEQAGGLATDGKNDILNIKPKSIHQKSPIYIGSSDMVKNVCKFIKK